jgi:uncharacterized protein YecE (DUF72 family)
LHRLGDIRIGISGWRYAPWRGVFYPGGLPQKRELAYASSSFRSIEINGTFYSLQRPESFAAWAADTPDDFVFAIKGPRYITHMLRLRGVDEPLSNFFASGMLRLGPKLGPFLWQFPPDFAFEAPRLEAFFKLLPRDTLAMAHMARRHGARMKGRAWLKAETRQPVRHAMEIRHPSFVDSAFIRLLRRYRVALVCADTVEWPRLMDLTSDFVYCRLHGSEELYASGYTPRALGRWARHVVAWAKGGERDDAERVIDRPGPRRRSRDVYVYFDNDKKVRAPFDARTLIRRTAGLLKAD